MAELDIVEFTTARCAEHEKMLQLAAAEPPHRSGAPVGTAVIYGLEGVGLSRHYQVFASWFDPERILAYTQFQRFIISRHRRCGDGYGVCDESGNDLTVAEGRCWELRMLAQLDREHPDFNQAWANVE